MCSVNKDLVALRTGKKPAQRSGEYWSKEELQRIEDLYEEGVGMSDIALQFDRTEVAVFQQLGKMGLLSRQCRPCAHKQEKSELAGGCHCPTCQVKDCQNCGKEHPYAGTV